MIKESYYYYYYYRSNGLTAELQYVNLLWICSGLVNCGLVVGTCELVADLLRIFCRHNSSTNPQQIEILRS